MTFANPSALWLFGVLPLFVVLSFMELRHTLDLLGRRQGPASRHGSLFLPYVRWFLGFLLQLAMVSSLVLALAGPAWGEDFVEEDLEGLSVMLILDESRSMDLTDQAPSRRGKARDIAAGLVSDLGEASFGLVRFQGNAELVVPMTRNHWALQRALANLDGLPPLDPGSRLDLALIRGLAGFPSSGQSYQVLVVLTDGGQLSARTVLEGVFRQAAERGIETILVGMGTPDPRDLTLRDGTVVDAASLPGRPGLDRESMASWAALARGLYVDAGDASSYNRLAQKIREISQEREEKGFRLQQTRHDSLFIALGLGFFLGGLMVRLIPWRRSTHA